MNLLYDVVQSDTVTGETIEKLVGKVTHYARLYSLQYERGFLLECPVGVALEV